MSGLRRLRSNGSRYFVEIIESSGRPAQVLADARAIRIDGLAPGAGIIFVDQLCDGNFGEVGIAHEVGAIHEGAAISLNGQVHRFSRIGAQRSQIEFL